MLHTCHGSLLLRVRVSHSAARTVDNSIDLHAVKPDIRSEWRFWPTLPAFDAPDRWGGGVAVGILSNRLVCKKTNGVATRW